jgi:hypothetical protein
VLPPSGNDLMIGYPVALCFEHRRFSTVQSTAPTSTLLDSLNSAASPSQRGLIALQWSQYGDINMTNAPLPLILAGKLPEVSGPCRQEQTHNDTT